MIDKSSFSISTGFDENSDIAYWKNQNYIERLKSMELMRKLNYGYEPSTERLQRVFEIAQLKKS